MRNIGNALAGDAGAARFAFIPLFHVNRQAGQGRR
jgi:hypothetical protein